jgi:hypothetical protein
MFWRRLTLYHIVLHWMVAYSIKKQDVKRAWEHIIINHLQPNNCLEEELILRFAMIMIVGSLQSWFRNFLKRTISTKYLHIHIRHKKNGHIEFSCDFGKKTTPFNFWSIDELEEVLTLFYEKYNNERLHSSVCNLNIF